jgi:hypothetical protein
MENKNITQESHLLNLIPERPFLSIRLWMRPFLGIRLWMQFRMKLFIQKFRHLF